MSKSHRSLCVSFSGIGAGLCIYHLLAWSNLNFLHISLWITLTTQPCLDLYSFCANLLHSLIIIIICSLLRIFTPALADVLYLSLSDNKSLLSILAVVRMFPTRPVISKSSSPYTNLFVTVPRAPITIGIIVTFMFHSFSNPFARSGVLISLFPFFWFPSVVCRDSKVYNSASSLLFFFFFFFVDYYKIWSSGRDLVICLYLEIPEACILLLVVVVEF